MSGLLAFRRARDAVGPAELVGGDDDGAAQTDVVLQRVPHRRRELTPPRESPQLPAELRALRDPCLQSRRWTVQRSHSSPTNSINIR